MLRVVLKAEATSRESKGTITPKHSCDSSPEIDQPTRATYVDKQVRLGLNKTAGFFLHPSL